MINPTLPPIDIPNSQNNPYGVTVKVGNFDPLEVVVPAITSNPGGQSLNIYLFVDGKRVAAAIVDPDDTNPISIIISPVFVRCCWQSIHYTAFNFLGEESSYVLHVLNEGT